MEASELDVLEQQMETLLELCSQLKRDNAVLRTEKAQLLEQNRMVKTKVKNMRKRLQTLSEN